MEVTIAISAKNEQNVIGDCLRSIVQQTEPVREVLVVDEPTDGTIPVAKQFGARVLLNRGKKLYEARNTALEHCRTEVLGFTDADCVLDPHWVARVKRILAEHPEVAAGTGRDPAIGKRNFSAWLHHMWYVVETRATGYTDGVIGGNIYFRTEALRKVGGGYPFPLWLSSVAVARKGAPLSQIYVGAGLELRKG